MKRHFVTACSTLFAWIVCAALVVAQPPIVPTPGYQQ